MTPIDRTREPAAGETIWSLIEEQAKADPGKTAILDGEREIDYEHLAERARAIAGALLARGVEPGSRIAVSMHRSWELVATLVGVLAAGSAYVPLDPAYPRGRLRAMLEHSRAAAAIVDREPLAELCDGMPVLRLEEVGDEAAGTLEGFAGPGPEDLAYVLYTSGSTGEPKGVAVEHRNVVAMARATRSLLDDEDLAGVLASASVSFDASVLEILAPLMLGGTLILAKNLLELPELPAADRVRTVTSVPTVMQALLGAGPLPEGVRCVIFGGEVLKRSLVDSLRAPALARGAPGPRVLNVYGPTEATVFVTAHEVGRGSEPITLGESVPGSRAHVVDQNLEPVPVGEPGELVLAGDQLARGYLHDEALTRERFPEVEPDGPLSEARLYRTGDRCRLLESGELEFLGRVDQQVKIRGFRVELEEVEAALEALEGVDAAAAAVVDGALGQKLLVAYVVSRDAGMTGEAARADLAERLPGYLVPQAVMRLEELPTLPNGKLDRDALPSELPAGSQAHAGTAPAADHEAVGLDPGRAGALMHHLAGLPRDEGHDLVLSILRGEVASLLRLADPEAVPPDHSVFDLGLDSLTVVELAARVTAILGHKVPASVILDRSTPAGVADHVLDLVGDAGEREAGRSSSDGPVTGGRARKGAANTLGSFQAQIQSCYPPFMAARARAWSVDDKAKFVRELKELVSGLGQDPHSKVVRTGSAHRGQVADVHTRAEREAIIWTTNLYLGLNRDREVIEAAGAALESFGTGMGTSAVAGGVTDLHLDFERGFADLVGKPAACLFPTGYTANLGVIAGILGEGDVVVMDQLCHASIVDGARLSGATIRTFQHNDPDDLEAVLRTEASPYRTVLVVLEGVYSMGEGEARVADIARTAKRHGALVLVDEAHSFGFYGPRGAGLCAAREVTDQVDFIMTTLSKALGSLGGVIAGTEEHIALLRSSARAYIFQASTSPAAIAAAVTALGRIRDDDSLRERLWDTTTYMRRRFTEAGYDLGSGDTPVVTPHFPDKDKLFAIVDGLFRRGVLTSAVTYPVVEIGKSRLRFICSASHTREDVDRTLEALIEAEREVEAGHPTERDAPEGSPGARGDLEAWADAFAAHLMETFPGETATGAPRPTPRLAVSVGLRDHGEPITLAVGDGAVTVGDAAAAETPFCSLSFANPRAASTLCASDVAGLFDSILRGTCTLSGQIEPFVWLVARLVDRRGARPTELPDAKADEPRGVGALA